MNYLDITQDFIEKSQAAESLLDLAGIFEKVIQDMGCIYFTCVSHVDPLNPPPHAVVLSNYPDQWAIRFSEQQYYLIDPVLMTAQERMTPFDWSDTEWRSTLSEAQINILNEACELDLKYGFSQPIKCTKGFPASCSVTFDSEGIDPNALVSIQLMSIYLHEAALRMKIQRSVDNTQMTLTKRQKQCLELVAQGKSDWDISVILNISQSTVHFHIQETLRKLNVSSRSQAVVRALFYGEIKYGDVDVAPGSPQRPVSLYPGTKLMSNEDE